MTTLQIDSDPRVELLLEQYPDAARKKLLNLRRIIFEVAEEIDGLDQLKETLKWGEPSYLTKKGSTIRIDWKAKSPSQYAMYFKCTSKLVTTFKAVFGNLFNYEGNRAIIFSLNAKVPESELRKCIATGLTYHRVKQLPNLGM